MVITVYRLYKQLFYCKHLCVAGSPLIFRNTHTLPNCTHQLPGIPQCKQYPQAGSHSPLFQLSHSRLRSVWCYNTSSQSVQASLSNGPLTTLQCFSTEPGSSHSKHSSLPSSNENSSEYQLMYRAPAGGTIASILMTVTGSIAGMAAVILPPLFYWIDKNPTMSLSVLLVGGPWFALSYKLAKTYVLMVYFNKETQMVKVHTHSVGKMTWYMFKPRLPFVYLFRSYDTNNLNKIHEFHISKARPPRPSDVFSSFRAEDKSYYIHVKAFANKKLLSLLGVFIHD